MTNVQANELVPRFQYERTLNQDQAGRRSVLYGHIDGQPALLALERAPFPTEPSYLGSVASRVRGLTTLGANDVYHWYLGRLADDDTDEASLKINLIWPCTPQHVLKYSRQGLRCVTETAAIYRDHVAPFVQAQRAAGRLAWVHNILEGRQETENVLFRTYPPDTGGNHSDGFLLLPDLNWDRTTAETLHLLALVERRDLASLRDLRRRHVPWLRRMRTAMLDAAVTAVTGTSTSGTSIRLAGPPIARDQLKLYVHYHPTYYHLHIHIVHVQLEAGVTQATGKAIGLDSIIEQLEHMRAPPGQPDSDDDIGMHQVSLTYTLGEASGLWTTIFRPLKAQEETRTS